MFEILLVGAVIFFGGYYIFKFIFFILGAILTGAGFLLKFIIMIILAIVFFPITLLVVGGILSGGLIGFLILCALIGVLVSNRRKERNYY